MNMYFQRAWTSKRHTVEEVAEQVEFHRNEAEVLAKEIPKTILITGFLVNLEGLRNELLQKKKNIYTTILEAQAYKLKRIVQTVYQFVLLVLYF